MSLRFALISILLLGTALAVALTPPLASLRGIPQVVVTLLLTAAGLLVALWGQRLRRAELTARLTR